MSLMLLYLVFVLVPNVKDWSQVTMGITGFSAAIFCVFGALAVSDDIISSGLYKKILVSLIVCFSISSFLNTALPSNKQMLMIAGGYAVSNNAELKAMPENVLKAVNSYLDALVTEEGEPKHDHH